MKQNCIILWCYILMSTGVFGQGSERFGTLDFHEITYAKMGEVHSILPRTDGSFYTVSAHGVETTAHLIDAGLTLHDSYFIEPAYYRSGSENAGMEYTRIGDRFYIIYAKDIKKTVTLYAAEFSNPKDVTTLASFTFKERTKAEIEQLLVSPSTEIFAVQFNVQSIDAVQTHVYVFDKNMTSRATYKIDKPEEVSIRNFVLNDSGDLFSLDVVKQKGETKKDKTTEQYKFRLFRNGNELAQHVVNDMTSTVASAKMTTDENHVYAYILTFERKEVTVSGKKQTKTEDVLHYWKFNDALQPALETENKISRTTIVKLQTYEKIVGAFIALKGVFVLEDGSSILIADASTYRAASTSHMFGELKSKSETWFYTGILIAHIDPAGKLTDTKSYHRRITGGVYMIMPVVPVRMENSVLFSYMDEDKSIHFVNAFVNADGLLETQKKMYTNDALDKRLIVQETMTSDGHKTAYAVVAFKNEVVRIHIE